MSSNTQNSVVNACKQKNPINPSNKLEFTNWQNACILTCDSSSCVANFLKNNPSAPPSSIASSSIEPFNNLNDNLYYYIILIIIIFLILFMIKK